MSLSYHRALEVDKERKCCRDDGGKHGEKFEELGAQHRLLKVGELAVKTLYELEVA